MSNIASPSNDQTFKEEQQKKHYFYLSQLQSLAGELPGKYQQRLPYDLLCSLANSLLDGTVFEIVHSLKEVQQLEERNLSAQRMKLVNEQKAQKQEMIRKHRDATQDCHSKPHNLPYVKSKCQMEMNQFQKCCDEELKRKDMKIIMELDQKVMDQQTTLEKSGVPGFFVTNNPQDVRLQMYLLEFIVRLHQMEIGTV